MAEMPLLLPHHREQLTQTSGIAAEVVAERGYRSISGPEGYTELKRLGFSRQQAKQTPGLLIPVLGLDGQPGLYQYRPDTPRINAKGHTVKYETPAKQTMRLDFGTGQRDLISNPGVGLWITEGAKKLDALRSHGLCGISLLGVWSWRGANLHGGKVALADWEQVPLNHRDVYLCFDSDVTTKPEVQQALNRLRRFLAQRGARVTVVYLPANSSEKVGVDDYLLSHTTDDLKALANPQPSDDETSLAPAPPYRATARGLVWLKPTHDGDIAIPLTNFLATIVGDTVTDDGAETTRQFALEATLNGRTHRFAVVAAQFSSLGWVSEHLGAQAMLYPGQAIKDHARAAIQSLSDVIVERRIFRHTDWRRNRDGEWSYFHGGGVLGQAGQVPHMEVALPSGLERLVLPDPPTDIALQQAVRASLSLLDVAPDHVSVPLWATIWRAVLSSADFGVHLTGPTGTAKTELACLLQQHFGASFDARHLPGSWLSIGNSLEDLAFTAKDAIFVIDDFAPSGTTTDIARTHREADRVLRAQGNLSGRQRMRADGTLKPAKPPRGLIFSTGEDIPRGQSLRARLVIVEVSPGDVDWTRLTTCQQDAASGLYTQAMAGHIQWLAPRCDHIRDHLARDVAELRAQIYQHDQHQRSVTNIASLAVGIKHSLLFAQDVGAITRMEGEALRQRCWTALLHVSAQQQRYQDASEPTQHFLRLVSAALASARAHFASPTGEEPEIPQAYGWRSVTPGTGPHATSDWQPQGRRISWVDGQDLYLEPEASYAEAQALATQQGEGMGVSAQTLRKRLQERRLLASTGRESEGRETLLVRRTIEGRRREVLHLHRQTLSPVSEKPDQPDHYPEPPNGGQVFGSPGIPVVGHKVL